MKITYFGHSCFTLSGKDYSVCLDPYGDIGVLLPEIKTDYYFCSHGHYDHDNVTKSMGRNIENANLVKVIKTYHDDSFGKLRGENKIGIFEIDKIKVAHMGDYGETENLNVCKELSGVDVLLIPIGGKYTINSKTAIKYIEQIKPKIAIPMHFKFKTSNVDITCEKEFLDLASKKYKIQKFDKNIEIIDIENLDTVIYFIEC